MTKTRELLEGTKEKSIFPQQPSYICLEGFFYKKVTENKNELVVRPGVVTGVDGSHIRLFSLTPGGGSPENKEKFARKFRFVRSE